jgi:anti-sigma regulatory factor (Ser/Thr protein kinase)
MPSKHYKVTADTHVQDTLNHIRLLCEKGALSRVKQNTILIICAELVNNIIKYADNGEVCVEVDCNQVRVKATDCGAGLSIPLEQAFVDSCSAAGTLGLGLSSIVRLSDEVRFCSTPAGVSVDCVVQNDV